VKESGASCALLVAQELGVSQARPVVDRYVKKLPALVFRETSVGSVSSYPMPWAVESPKFLRVDVNEFARLRAFIPVVGHRRLESAELPQSTGRDDTLSS